MQIRVADRADLPAVVALVRHEDELLGEAPVDEALERAFASIEADVGNELLVADDDGTVVACLQATYVPRIGGDGGDRVILEGIRVRVDRRGAGLGRALLEYALERARARGCTLAALTSSRRRADAHRFYESLGFERSHEGFRQTL